MPPKTNHHTSLNKGISAIYLNTEYRVNFENLPPDFNLLNGHVLFCLLLNGRCIPPTVKTLEKIITTEGSIHFLLLAVQKHLDRLNPRVSTEKWLKAFKLLCKKEFIIHRPQKRNDNPKDVEPDQSAPSITPLDKRKKYHICQHTYRIRT